MYTTFGVLAFPELASMPTANKKQRLVKFGAEALKAMEIFCRVCSPSQKAYEPQHLLKVIGSQDNLPTDFPIQAEAIRKMVESAHGQSLNKHFLENPYGSLPNRIIFQKHLGEKHKRCTFTWQSSHGEFRVVLTLYRSSSPSLRIVGRTRAIVSKRAALARLPDPTLAQGLSLPRTSPLSPSPLVALQDVKVPIGDLLDFLAKYRR